MTEERFRELIDTKTMIVILGPTASGKTGASIELSRYVDCEVISADSRQLYKYMDIGTAKPTAEEQAAMPHHFIDFVEPNSYYSAGVFGDEAEKCALDILKRNKLPVVVGGSGLYIQALCEGFFSEDDSDTEKRKEVQLQLARRLENEGSDTLYNELKAVDPVSAARYPDKNPRRTIRALEYYLLHSEPLSSAQQKKKDEKPFNCRYFGIDFDRDILYDRINLRADIMWQQGLIEETKRLLDMGFSPELNALNTVGYKEAIAYLNGSMTETEALEKLKQNTRRYAKRQLTWFRRIKETYWARGNSSLDIAKSILSELI